MRGPEAGQRIEHRLADQLDGVTGQEEVRRVPLGEGGPADEEAQRGRVGASGPEVRWISNALMSPAFP